MAVLQELADIFHSALVPPTAQQPPAPAPLILVIPVGRPLQAPPVMPTMAYAPPPRVSTIYQKPVIPAPSPRVHQMYPPTVMPVPPPR
eukprot:6505653-Ditylum_brightwellii.AAC.1